MLSSDTPPTRHLSSKLATQLLSDLAPELSLRLTQTAACDPTPHTLPPSLYRGLLSMALRASSRDEAASAREALRAAQALPQECPGACLGFTPLTPPTAITAVLVDLLASAARHEPLLPSSPALAFYAEAGPGAADADEFHAAAAEHRVRFCDERRPLADVRVESLAAVVRLLADVLACNADAARLVSEAVAHERPAFLAPLIDVLPRMVHVLPPDVLAALQEFYGRFLAGQTEVVRGDVLSKFVKAFMTMTFERPDNLGLYISSMRDPTMQYSACRMCLVQRYKVRVRTGVFGLSQLLRNFLAVRSEPGRVNSVVPALLTGLIMGWYTVARREEFVLRGVRAIGEAVQTLSDAKARIGSSQFGASDRDVAAFNMAIIALTHRIIDCNSP